MLRFFALRLGRALLTILLVVTFAFIVLRLSGDPALLIMSPDAPAEAIAAFRHAWGLDQPIWVQYLHYFIAIGHGDLGQSMRDGRPAVELVAERIPATVALTLPALALKLCVGIPAGIYAALHRDTAIDRGVMALATAGFTVPSFVLGLVLVLVFAVQLRWLPSGGQEGWRQRRAARDHARVGRCRRAGTVHPLGHAGGVRASPISAPPVRAACPGPPWCAATRCRTRRSRPSPSSASWSAA